MITLDMRLGSEKLLEPLRKAGLPVEEANPPLPAGDLMWIGRGEQGAPLVIGIEYKHLSELISSLRTDRLAGYQLHAMRAAEEGQKPLYDVAYLLVEGEVIYDERGQLLRRSSRQTFKPLGMNIDEMRKRLISMHLCGGLNLIESRNQRDSVQWIKSLYHSWTDKDLDEHRSHLALYEPPPLVPLTKFERTVRTLPGVGLQFAKGAEKTFKSIRRAINASGREWANIESENDGKTRKLGQAKAEKIVDYVS